MKEGNEPTRWRVLICICLKWQVREQLPDWGFLPLCSGWGCRRAQSHSHAFLPPPLLCSEGGQGVNPRLAHLKGSMQSRRSLQAQPAVFPVPADSSAWAAASPGQGWENISAGRGIKRWPDCPWGAGSPSLERFRRCGTQNTAQWRPWQRWGSGRIWY